MTQIMLTKPGASVGELASPLILLEKSMPKFTLLWEMSRFIEVEIEAKDIDEVSEMRFTDPCKAFPDAGFDPNTDYSLIRIDWTDKEGHPCEYNN